MDSDEEVSVYKKAEYEAQKAENDAINKECKRLAVLFQEPHVLDASEVTETGLYKWRGNNMFRWVMVRESICGMRMALVGDHSGNEMELHGQFIGPLKALE